MILVDMKPKKIKRQKLNLTIDPDVKRQIKIYSAVTSKDISRVTEALWVKFLKQHPEGYPPDVSDPEKHKKAGLSTFRRGDSFAKVFGGFGREGISSMFGMI